MACADIAPGHPQIRDILREQRAQRDVIVAVGMPVPGTWLGGVHAPGRVQIYRPAAEADAVIELSLPEHILLGQHMLAHEPAVLPFAGHRSDPFQGEGLRVELAGILDVVPQAVADRLELITDLLVVMDHIEFAAPFDPPEGAPPHVLTDHPMLSDPRRYNVHGEGRCDELRGAADVLGIEQDGDRKSTRLNSSHVAISYAVCCLKKKKQKNE